MASGIDKNTLTIITTNKTSQSDPSTSASDIDSTSTNSQNIIQDSTQSYEAKKELRSRKNRTQSVCISISETIKIKTNNAPIEANKTNECEDFKSNVSSSSGQFPSRYIRPVDKKSAIPILDHIAEETPEDVENFNKAIAKTKKKNIHQVTIKIKQENIHQASMNIEGENIHNWTTTNLTQFTVLKHQTARGKYQEDISSGRFSKLKIFIQLFENKNKNKNKIKIYYRKDYLKEGQLLGYF